MVAKRTRNVYKVELIRDGLPATYISIELRRIGLPVKRSILITAKEGWSRTLMRCQRMQNFL